MGHSPINFRLALARVPQPCRQPVPPSLSITELTEKRCATSVGAPQ